MRIAAIKVTYDTTSKRQMRTVIIEISDGTTSKVGRCVELETQIKIRGEAGNSEAKAAQWPFTEVVMHSGSDSQKLMYNTQSTQGQ
jgi:hypothetical protein